VLPYLQGERIADVGSGAGFPGIPLAIVEPGRRFSLIESTGKKCRFLEHVRDALELKNVEVVQVARRGLQARRPFRYGARPRRRAARRPREASPRRLVVGGGRLLAMKGRYPEDELAAKLSGWKVAAVHPLTVPGPRGAAAPRRAHPLA
jgi:16S rRNA (guanine527-N7)-methyltransferase